MSSHPETNVSASTVGGNSVKSPSDTGCRFCNEVGQRAGTGMCFICDFDFESCDALPDEEYRTYSTSSLGFVNRQAETAAGQASVWNNPSKYGGEHDVKTELPSGVSKIPDSRVTHFARTANTRNSKRRPAQGRNEQSGVTQRKVEAEFKTRAFTRSQGQVSSEKDGASTAGGNTAVKIEDDVGQISIKEEES